MTLITHDAWKIIMWYYYENDAIGSIADYTTQLFEGSDCVLIS